MGSFGERLRREREMRGIGLEEIAEATKIGSRSLRALEEENFQQLPGGIFNKGFVRAYARHLGIDEEQAVSDFMAAEAAAKTGPIAPLAEAEQRPHRSLFSPVVIVIAIAVLALGGWRVWRSRAAEPGTPSQHVAVSPRPGNPAVETGHAPSPTTPQPIAPAPSAAKPGPPGTSPQGVPAAATTAAPAANPKAAPPETNANGFVVLVRAREETWLSVASDNAAASEYTLQPPNEKSFRARDRLVLKVGNLPGLEISYNGKPLAIPATDNKVRTLTFTATGYQQE